MFDPKATFDWIEKHPQTIEILKWTGLLVAAWLSGLVRLIYSRTRKPRAHISETTSRCLVEEFTEIEGYRNAMRVSYLLEIEVVNLSAEEIVVRTFNLAMRRRWWRRGPALKTSAVSLPNRVHHQMGHGVKLMRNWFSMFQDGRDDLTEMGSIAPRHASSGFALFVTFTYGNHNPAIVNGRIPVAVQVGLTTGKVRATGDITVTKDAEFFERMVPGIREQISHPTAWNVPLRGSRYKA